MKSLLYIMILVLGCFLIGCRASKESKARYERTNIDEIGVELRRVDSLWSSIAERLTYKIEFYPAIEQCPGKPENIGKEPRVPAAPSSTMPATNLAHTSQKGSVGGGMGAVKSIEFTVEHDAQSGTATQVDSSYNSTSDTKETLQEQKASEARQDNGTVATVSIVAAVALLVFFLLKTYLKK